PPAVDAAENRDVDGWRAFIIVLLRHVGVQDVRPRGIDEEPRHVPLGIAVRPVHDAAEGLRPARSGVTAQPYPTAADDEPPAPRHRDRSAEELRVRIAGSEHTLPGGAAVAAGVHPAPASGVQGFGVARIDADIGHAGQRSRPRDPAPPSVAAQGEFAPDLGIDPRAVVRPAQELERSRGRRAVESLETGRPMRAALRAMRQDALVLSKEVSGPGL